MSKKGRTNAKYSAEFKIKVVEAYLGGEYGSLRSTVKHFGVKNKRQLQNWLQIYKSHGEEAFLIEKRGRTSTGRPKKINLDKMSLEQQVEYLKMENDILKKVKALLKD